MSTFQTMRLIWIDAFVNAGFMLQREHICVTFDISVGQASLDLRTFQTLFPDRLSYDRSEKGYRAKPESSPAFLDVEHCAVFVACSRAANAHQRISANLPDEDRP